MYAGWDHPVGAPTRAFPTAAWAGNAAPLGHHLTQGTASLTLPALWRPWWFPGVRKGNYFTSQPIPGKTALLQPSECKTFFPHIWSLEAWIVISGNWCLLLQWLCGLGNKALLAFRRFVLSLEMFATSLASCALLWNKRKLYQASKLWYFLVLPVLLFPSKIWVPVCPGYKICKGNIFGEELYSEYGKVKFLEVKGLAPSPIGSLSHTVELKNL